MTVDECHALLSFAREHGRHWRRILQRSWETGVYATSVDTSILQRLRNTVGPTGLHKLNVSDLKTI